MASPELAAAVEAAEVKVPAVVAVPTVVGAVEPETLGGPFLPLF